MSLKFEVKAGVRIYPDGREVCDETPLGRAEYNDRRLQMWRRQKGICAICQQEMRLFDVSFDHKEPRKMGGSERDDRIVDSEGNWLNQCVHWICNVQKGSKREQSN